MGCSLPCLRVLFLRFVPRLIYIYIRRYVGLYLKTGYSLPGHRASPLWGSRGVSAGTRYGHPASFGRAYGLPVASCSAKRQAMAPTGACARARATPPLSPLSCSTEKQICAPAQPAQSGTAGAVAGIAPGPRAPDQRSRAAQISSRVYGALVGRPADALPPATAPCFCAAAALSCSILLPLAHCHRRPSSLQSGIKSRGRAWEAARAVP